MKRFTLYTIGTVFGLALSSAAWAQQGDLEVTMDVVPANASEAGSAHEIRLPIMLPATASPRGQESSAFGQETANAARETARELGREFGRAQSERARAQDRHPNKGGPKAP